MSGIVNVHEAKTHLSRLLERVRRGEEVVIGKGGRPVARLVPIEQAQARRAPGSARGRFRVARNFDAPLPKSVASLPAHHRDPFDRLLVAQAAADGLTLVSRDPQLAKYGTPILW